jgi:acetyltransferase-like isoleucine patch superfamily enzyme
MVHIVKKIKKFTYITFSKMHSSKVRRMIYSCGVNLNVFGKIDIISPKNLSIGDNCTINHGVYINCINKIKIGSDVTLSAGAKVISSGIDYEEWAKENKCHLKGTDIEIGDHVWIGSNAQILPGVKISGKYVVIASGAIVTKNICEDYCIVAGVPAKVIKRYK